jgi:hypothetical protein
MRSEPGPRCQAILGVSLLLSACSGGQSGVSPDVTMTIPPPLTADFESIQTNVFTPICSSCHSGANPPANLNLDAAHSYANLVNVPSSEQPELDRVKPGDPDNSFLIIHMKNDGDGAPESDIPIIAQWITDGALSANGMAPP